MTVEVVLCGSFGRAACFILGSHRLVDHRLVKRTVDRSNRRETTISLTAKGRALVDRVTVVRRAEIRQIVDRIPEDLRAPAVTALVSLIDAAGEPSQVA